MATFKYSSELVPTQTLQLNTMKMCLYVFKTHNLKLPSAEQEAILSSCKNNSSWFFSPLPYWDEFDKLQSRFQLSLKHFHSLLPQPVIQNHTGDKWEAKSCDSGFPSHPRSTLLCFFLSPLKSVCTFLLTIFNWQVLPVELKRCLYFLGRKII